MPNRQNKPNILVIMSDEHDAAVTGCYGDSLVQTPHLDNLASDGITFDACYTNSPLCVPARLSFTACQYVSRFGGWNNHCWLPSDDYPSIPHAMNQAGYESVLCGKMHYDKTRRYGFSDLLPSHSTHTKTGKGFRRPADDVSIGLDSWKERSAEFYPADQSHVLNRDREVTEVASRFLSQRQKGDKPFFMLAGYVAPHFPLIAPEEIYQKYQGKVPMPEIPEGFLDTLPTNYQQLRKGFGIVDTESAIVQKGRDLYWALTEWFDTEVGKLLNALDDSEVADNTVVIYTSDHGENKGDHGMWWKNCMYEHSARIPLIVNWPKRWAGGQRRSQACSLVDVVQTIAAMGGAEAHESWDGDSMLDWLDDSTVNWKGFALSEYYGHNISSGFTMVRKWDYKYVYHARMDERHGPERELYNLKNDPKEFCNLASDPDQVENLHAMHNAMVEELGEEPDVIEQRCRDDYARGYHR